MNKTIIYYTDNKLDETLAKRCREKLVEAAEGTPIISVSQKPIDLGINICVGEIGSSWLNLYKQLLAGAEAAQTEYIATAEHDCLYTNEHFKWTPHRDDVFFYNENVYLVEWGGNHPELNGMYSTFWAERKALSQLVCSRRLLIESIRQRLSLLDQDIELVRKMVFAGEPGVSLLRIERAQKIAKSGKHNHLQKLLEDYLKTEVSDVFRTQIPNLDIRHKTNFTGPKRGKNRTYNLPYWGEFKNIMQ